MLIYKVTESVTFAHHPDLLIFKLRNHANGGEDASLCKHFHVSFLIVVLLDLDTRIILENYENS